MEKHTRIQPPFFEIGPKNYLFGKEVVDLARLSEEASLRYKVNVIFTTPYINISEVVAQTEKLYVFAPHMDAGPVGRGLANVLPESIRAAGARGVMLNHAERPLCISELIDTMRRAQKLRLMTIVCASSILETCSVAQLHPDMIVSEPLELIGTGESVDTSFVRLAMEAVRSVDRGIGVLVGGGVSSGEDVYNIIRAGADATGSSSAIALAKDPGRKIDEMLYAVRQAWDEREAAEEVQRGQRRM